MQWPTAATATTFEEETQAAFEAGALTAAEAWGLDWEDLVENWARGVPDRLQHAAGKLYLFQQEPPSPMQH
ncbi:hypothetical protein D3C85_866160 [compost metagenome]